MKQNWFLGVAVLTITVGYFLFFFETDAQKEQRLAEEEQAKIEALGEWSTEARETTSNRAVARELGMEMGEFTEQFGDISTQSKDLHFKSALFLSTIYPIGENKYVMTVSYGPVDKLTRALVNLTPEREPLSDYSMHIVRVIADKGYDSKERKIQSNYSAHFFSKSELNSYGRSS